MAKRLRPLTWPYRLRGLYLVLGLSLLANALFISFVWYINSRSADVAMLETAVTHMCSRDYGYQMSKLTDENSKILLSEGVCKRDITTTNPLAADRVKIAGGHFVQN